MVKKLTPLERKTVVKSYSAKRVSNVVYKNGHISLKFGGKKLRNKVIVKHDPQIANWSRKRHEIHYDEHVGKRDILPVLVHEMIEKYLTEKFHLSADKEPHRIANKVEKNFMSDACSRKYKYRCTHSGRCWRLHEDRIEKAWLKENT